MNQPAFWQRPDWRATALSPLATLYDMIARRRYLAACPVAATAPVICISNPTVGGAGKTPAAIAVADMLAGAGHRPVFLSRGYGGQLSGPVRVEPEFHKPRDVGDEPILLARRHPAVVSVDRPRGAALAVDHGDVIVMDDGFQNPSLKKDLSILVVDGETGLGNGRCLPAGPLRMDFGFQAERAQALLVVGNEGPAGLAPVLSLAPSLPVLRGTLEPAGDVPEGRLVAFAGIGRPEKFFDTLRGLGADVVATVPFADHHPFTDADARRLRGLASENDAMLVTTEKDSVRLHGDLAAETSILPVRMTFESDSRASLEQLLAAVTAGG